MKDNKQCTVEDESIGKLFADYNPEMKSGNLFMSRLETSMKSVEPVKERLDSDRRVSRIAVAAAAVAGFLFGILVTVFFPEILSAVESVIASVEYINVQSCVTPVTWSLISMTGMVIVYFTYDIVRLATISRRDRRKI